MPSQYKMADPVARSSVNEVLTRALPNVEPNRIRHIRHGSGNAVYQVVSGDNTPTYALKVCYRPDRISGGILAKEAQVLRRFSNESWSIQIPAIHWEGETVEGYPAVLMDWLPGMVLRDLLKRNPDTNDAMRQLGRFNAELHKQGEATIDEFEVGRPQFSSFRDCVEHWLEEWRPLHEQALPEHISQAALEQARTAILSRLDFFDDQAWAYNHGDLSAENVLGKIHRGKLVLTGVCDFETAQTGPPEYDLGNASNGFFIFYPELEAPFYEGYTAIRALHSQFNDRMIACALFRSLRYIKRSVKYKEVHYYDHDRQFLETWLERAA